MSLRVLEQESQRLSPTQAKVTVEGGDPEEVMSKEAKEMALNHGAQLGISRPGLGLGGGPYPADNTCRLYRYDYQIQAGL